MKTNNFIGDGILDYGQYMYVCICLHGVCERELVDMNLRVRETEKRERERIAEK